MKMQIKDLHHDPANVRKHGERNHNAIKASLQRFGQQKPIVVGEGNIVIAGNGTLAAARDLGWKEIDVAQSQLVGAEATAFAIADNRTAELAEWDDDALAETMAALQNDDTIDHLAAGFSDDEIADLIAESTGITDDEVEEDEVPEPPADPVTKPGDLWILGDHRLLCGDSTKRSDVDRVLNGAKRVLCLTDPPYGLGDKKASGKNDYDVHEDTEESLKSLISGWVPIARDVSQSVVFSCGVKNLWLYPPADWAMSWFYGAGQLCSSWGFSCWQPFVCYGKDPSLAVGKGRRPDAVNMNTPANASEIDHPCPKPLAVWHWFIDRMSFSDGDVFYEPFSGSGTTIIAAEQKRKRCYAIELSPNYCDVAVQRWETLTGKKAVLDG